MASREMSFGINHRVTGDAPMTGDALSSENIIRAWAARAAKYIDRQYAEISEFRISLLISRAVVTRRLATSAIMLTSAVTPKIAQRAARQCIIIRSR